MGMISVAFVNVESKEMKVFTREEAITHLNASVRSICNASFVLSKGTKGKVASINKDDFIGGYLVVIDWEHSLRGRHEIIHTAKETFEKCFVKVGEPQT